MAYFLRNYLGWVVALLAGGLAVPHPACAQTTRSDSTAIRYEEEILPAPAPAPAAASRLQVQEHQLWKLGLNNVFYLPANWSREISTIPAGHAYGRYGLHLGYERKLGSRWSALVETSPYLLNYQSIEHPLSDVALCARAQLAGRYYYNLNRRLRLGKAAGTFAGNYFSLALGAGLGQRAHETAFFFFPQSGPFARFDAALLYGLQRRLGRYGFADFNVGLPLALSSGAATSTYYFGAKGPTLAVNLRLGLCLGR